MHQNKHTGNRGETLAAAYLQQNGYTVLEKNWRYRYWEVDLIASKGNRLHFFEIKTRTSAVFGLPEESISRRKMDSLKNAAEEYQYQHPEWQYLQFDVLSVMLYPGQAPEFFLIEDVYF
jgi:putative endonuclease